MIDSREIPCVQATGAKLVRAVMGRGGGGNNFSCSA